MEYRVVGNNPALENILKFESANLEYLTLCIFKNATWNDIGRRWHTESFQ
jgi:hypothetical protein